MLKYLIAYWPWVILSVSLSFLVVNFEALSLWFGASLVQTLFKPDGTPLVRPEFSIHNLNAILKYYTSLAIRRENPLDSLKIVCALMAFTFFMKNALTYSKSLVTSRLNLNIVRDMRNQLYDHTMRLPVTYFDRSKSGNMMSLIVNDVQSINASMTGTFDKLFTEPMRVIAFVTMLFIINVKLTLAIFIIFPIIGLLIGFIGKSVRRRSKRVLEFMAGLLSILHETIGGIRAVKMFNMNDAEARKFAAENNKFIHHSYKSTSIASISSPLTEVLGVVVVIILLWYGGHQVLASQGFSAEDFVGFLLFLFSIFTPLKTLSNLNNTLQQGFAAAERVFTVLDSSPEILQPLKPANIPSFEKNIKFKQVHFTYPGSTDEVLNDLNFTIKKGSIVALVGSSGAGKSTILDLVPRFYDISSGNILIDDIDIKTMDLVGLRHLFGIVSQETVLFNETVFNNIAYGLPDASYDQVKNAALAANAWEFIERMPNGLDTIIGERGVMLSGGQRQRLSIARALLRNPPVLILDEATSALDTESEQFVQTAINNLIENRTALVVAHRLSTIRHADTIIVLENGRIVEQGPHQELLALGKRYKYFHDIQFASLLAEENR
jgi:subfamily B ATP-binding cassette protein MsbA